MGAIIAVVNRVCEDATETAVAMLKMLARKSECSGIASPKTVIVEKSIEALQNQDVNSSIVIGHVFSKFFAHDKPQPIKLKDATIVFEGRIYPTKAKISYAEAVAQKLQISRELVGNLVKELDGCFVFAVAESERVAAGRDALGVYPFYYGENRDLVALASERKALWKIGMKNVNSFPPGHVAFVDRNGFRFQPVKTLTCAKSKRIEMTSAAKKLQQLLRNSVKERVKGLSEVAVAFSGGLDSSILAFLANDSGPDVHLICVSLGNQQEMEYAKKAAEELKLPIHIYLYSENDVESVLPKVLWLIEEPDPIKASIGIPFYWTAEKVAEMNLKVLLAGQGADELFGGYKRYVSHYLQYNSEKVHRTIFSDILNMYENNLERDFKICNYHDVELRLPFATYPMAKFATELPLELKIEKRENGLRKLVLRQVAKDLGLPQLIAEKPKKAIQYTTGVNKALKMLAKRNGLSVKAYLQKIFKSVFKKLDAYD